MLVSQRVRSVKISSLEFEFAFRFEHVTPFSSTPCCRHMITLCLADHKSTFFMSLPRNRHSELNLISSNVASFGRQCHNHPFSSTSIFASVVSNA